MPLKRIEFVSKEYGRIKYTLTKKAGSSPITELYANGSYGRVIHQLFQEDAYTLWYSRFQLYQNMHLSMASNHAVLSLNFALENTFHFHIDEMKGRRLLEGQFNLVFIPHLKSAFNFKKKKDYQLFGIHYTKDYLKRWENQFHFLSKFLLQVEKNIPITLTHKHYRSTPKMKAILWDIIQCMQSLAIKKIGLEVKALKLLEASLEQMELSVKSGRLSAISSEDIFKIQQAKKYLLEHLEQPITLKKLARKLGTNTFKLKTGFKSMYSVSVIAYLREARMQKARKLLLESQMPIYLIALEIGYANSANFTTTFKKRFGYSPRSLRN